MPAPANTLKGLHRRIRTNRPSQQQSGRLRQKLFVGNFDIYYSCLDLQNPRKGVTERIHPNAHHLTSPPLPGVGLGFVASDGHTVILTFRYRLFPIVAVPEDSDFGSRACVPKTGRNDNEKKREKSSSEMEIFNYIRVN